MDVISIYIIPIVCYRFVSYWYCIILHKITLSNSMYLGEREGGRGVKQTNKKRPVTLGGGCI